MSDDLISRKEAIDILENMMFEVGKDLSKSYLLQDAKERISQLNTAFDKEKVIKKLKHLEKDTFDYYNRYNDEMAFGESAAFRSAIEIVEKGGIERRE